MQPLCPVEQISRVWWCTNPDIWVRNAASVPAAHGWRRLQPPSGFSMFLLLNQPSNNTLGVPMRREPGPVPGHYLILCFPKRTRQTFSPSFRPESTGRCPREGWWSCGSQQELSQEQPWPIPPWRPGEEGRSVTLGKEIPPGQGGGFNPRFTEVWAMPLAFANMYREVSCPPPTHWELTAGLGDN